MGLDVHGHGWALSVVLLCRLILLFNHTIPGCLRSMEATRGGHCQTLTLGEKLLSQTAIHYLPWEFRRVIAIYTIFEGILSFTLICEWDGETLSHEFCGRLASGIQAFSWKKQLFSLPQVLQACYFCYEHTYTFLSPS